MLLRREARGRPLGWASNVMFRYATCLFRQLSDWPDSLWYK